MRGLLVRVGIDQTPEYGGWNAPVNTQTWRFMSVPIRDSTYNDASYVENGERIYGKEVIASEQPLSAALKGDVWTVTGSVPCDGPPGAPCPGGAAEVRDRKSVV